MPNNIVAVDVTVAGETRHEGIQLFKNQTWKSPAGGWLGANSGTWIQAATAGVVLSSGSKRIGLLKGIIFDIAEEGLSGDFIHDAGGDAGRYSVVGTSP